MGDFPNCHSAAIEQLLPNITAMAAFYTAMAAFYFAMATFYTAMATFYNIEHSRKLCSQKVSSPVFRVTRTDPHIFSRCPHLTMVSRNDQPTSKKDKLATIRMNQPHSKKDKLATILDPHYAMLDPVLHTVPTKPGCTPMPCWTPCCTRSPPSHAAHLCYAGPRAGHCPQPCHAAHPCLAGTRAGHCPDQATLHTLAKVLTMEDLFSFSCLPPKEHCRFFLNREETEGERKKERENEWPRQFPACLIYPASL